MNTPWVTLWTASASLAVASVAAAGLDWKDSGSHRSAPLAVPGTGRPGFTSLPSESTGVSFTNFLSEARRMENANLMNGSGVALGDMDGDGLCDVLLCSLEGKSALYRNLGGWRFADVTAAAGVGCAGQSSTGAAFADLDGDGWLDLVVLGLGGPNACFRNLGQGRFTNITVQAGLTSRLGGTSLALADVDGNGTLDLYVANYGATSILRSGGALNVSTGPDGRQVVRGRYAQRLRIIDGVMYELGEPDALYLNDGAGQFRAVSWTDGRFRDAEGKPLTAAPWDQGLTVLFRDINQDGSPDLYLCNDAFTPDRCWINDGTGRFRALSVLGLRQTSYFSMGGDFGDLDRDGLDDLFVVDMQSRDHALRLTQKGTMHPQPKRPGDLRSQMQIRRNTLFRARGDGTFAEIADYAGVESADWAWSAVFLDVDLDGWEDILVSNGFLHNVDDLDTRDQVEAIKQRGTDESRRSLLMFPTLATPNVAFHNQRNLTFRERGGEWGFDSKLVSNGMALGDLDNDGDLDVVVNCLNGPALVYRNESVAPRVAVRLRGRAPNTRGIGARIRVVGGPVPQSQEMIAGSRYASGDDPVRVFAAGQANRVEVEVTWRSGRRSVISDALPNHVYEIAEPDGPGPLAEKPPESPEPLMRDVSEQLGHTHAEESFDDFIRQPLLPRKLSQLGPGVAWLDLDGDGWEDLVVGGGKGGRLMAYRNAEGRGFAPVAPGAQGETLTRDQTGVVGWATPSGQTQLLVGSANYEDGRVEGSGVLRFHADTGGLKAAPGLPMGEASVGPLSLGDVDGDGDLDLFVGARVVGGRYPLPGPSRLFLQEAGGWKMDGGNEAVVRDLGLVAGACFSDLNGDGWADLVVAVEWGPVRVLLNERGRLRDATGALGLSGEIGWWSGVTTGDLDGDGRLDIVAGNWGLNSPYRADASQPVRLFYGDMAGIGGVELLEAYDDAGLGTVPRRDLQVVGGSLPFLRERFPTHTAYAKATVAGILGQRASTVRELRASVLASSVFMNRGDRFEARRLPAEAQWAPVFALVVGDWDGDGAEDVFAGQNFCATPDQVPRQDAGRGLLLRGDGRGGLTSMRGQDSGIVACGEQRGAAAADFDQDGRLDLVLTQNGGATQLYRNHGGTPGLRVRLAGRAGNPMAVGAQIRLQSGEWQGAVRELRAGAGYWSQDGAVQVLAASRPIDAVWVRWPGGRTTVTAVAAGAKELRVVAPE